MEHYKETYEIKKKIINSRLNDFKRFYSEPVSWVFSNNKMKLVELGKNDNERIFEELSFCLLTANTSAAMSMKAIDHIRPILTKGSIQELSKKLIESGYRFPNKRAEYIFEAREKLQKEHNVDIKSLIENRDAKETRDFFVDNIKGLGYKEASHFLRNIGVFGLAILDKHILRTMHENNMIEDFPKSLNRKRYLEIEEKFKEFSDILNIDMDALDLLLWSMKNGEIMK